jgi:radical SAM superfamily enzyme YgiQ (UPF0313 family)
MPKLGGLKDESDTMKSNILLISPASDNEALWITGKEGPEVKNNFPPLGLATIAGLTPSDFHVDIWDEVVHGLIDEDTRFARNYALVGITGYKSHLPRSRQLAIIFRQRSIPVAIGGPGVSGTPDEYADDFDFIFIGEAEKTWPSFLRDWQAGNHKSEYRQIEKIDLADSPLPKWDSIAADLPLYAIGCVQTTRGCPFDCDFCDVIYLFGRRPRHKPLKNILEEVKILERLGLKSIFFSDDEFIGDRRYTKELLKELIPLNRSFRQPLTFSAQVTMNLSKDEELMQLLADANFDLLFIGIETPNKASLKASNKLQNLATDLVGEIHKILSYGLAIRAGIIVGFDNDDMDIFGIQSEFIEKSFIPSVAINMLKAPFGTKLWARLRQEGRVVIITPEARGRMGHPRSYTNIIPRQMSRVELLQGYRELLVRVFSWESFTQRVNGFAALVRRPPEIAARSNPETEIQALLATLDVGPAGRQAIKDIILNTARVAPFFLERVRALIVQHAKYRESVNTLLFQLDRQIELESSGQLSFERDQSPVPIPMAFREAYKSIFPEVYNRVYANLKDKNQGLEALVEVFMDFMLRCGAGFTRLEDYHRIFLEEICDRTCAKFNLQPPEEFVPLGAGDQALPAGKRFHIGEDILKSVEQKLFKLGKQERVNKPAQTTL